MQLATKWFRYKNNVPAGGKVLGTADPVPTGYIDGADNVAGIRLRFDRPMKRLAVAGVNTGGQTTITFDVYIWEASTLSWQKITTAAVTLTFGTLAYVPLPSLAPAAQFGNDSLDCYVRVIAAGTEADGIYTFSAGPVQNE